MKYDGKQLVEGKEPVKVVDLGNGYVLETYAPTPGKPLTPELFRKMLRDLDGQEREETPGDSG